MSALLALPWVWAALAVVLAIAEVLVPGYILLGFALGAGAVAGLLAVGVPGLAGSLPVMALVFAVVSLAAWLGLRKVFGLRGGSVRTFDHDIND